MDFKLFLIINNLLILTWNGANCKSINTLNDEEMNKRINDCIHSYSDDEVCV